MLIGKRTIFGFCILVLVLVSQSGFALEGKPTLRQHIEAMTGDYPLMAQGKILQAQSTLKNFYLDNNFSPAWHDAEQQPTPQARILVQEIGRIDEDGLLPADYHYSQLRDYYLDAKSGQNPGDYVEFDLLLSDAAATLSQHLLAGKVDPETLSAEWQAQRRSEDLTRIILELSQAADVAARLNELRPNQVRYFRLKKLLMRLRHTVAPDWPRLAVAPIIKPGTIDSRLPAIRERLRYWGDLDLAVQVESDAEANAVYDQTLAAAVRNFQRRHGLEEDGIIGRATFDALNISPAEREQQVVNNLERWRWLAEDLGERHVLVNIAGFELKTVENNRTVLTKPVIVGRDYRRTPVFSDRIRYLVFNPTWTVPMSIAVKDQLPAIRQDPEYFSRLGMTVFDRDQNRVDPAQVDWQALGPRNFPYRLVQSPGPLNALGQVKFMFPNAHDVYLHDTPARDLFTKTDRAFSSGCVRVADPMELAAWLLEKDGLSRNQIDAIVAKGDLRTVFLKEPVPVHIEYWTAWIDSREELHFRNDIYRRDPPLSAALAAPLYPQ